MASLTLTAHTMASELPDKASSSRVLMAPAQVSANASTFTNFLSANGMYTWGLPGASAGETYDVAMYVPAYLQGTVITSVGFRLYNPEVLRDVKAWVSATLPTSASAADVCQSVENPVAYGIGNNEIELTEAYTVPATGCYIGYSFTVADASAIDGQEPILTDYNATYVRNFYVKGNTTNTDWQEQRFANTTLVAGIDSLPTLSAAFDSHDLGKLEQSFLIGESKTVSIPFVVTGSTAVNRLTYQVKDLGTGVVSKEITTTCTRKKFGNVSTFKFALGAADAEGISEKEFTILKVNNKELTSTVGNTGRVTTKTFASGGNRTVVEEMFTATSTPWDVRGMMGMEHMEQNNAGNWIGIAVHTEGLHYDDPMYCADYRYVPPTSGYPGAKLNRGTKIDPYYGAKTGNILGIATSVSEAAARPTEGAVSVKAAWSADGNKVNVSAEASFTIDRDDAPYSIGYVLVGNGLKATTTEKATAYPWWQYNSYYGSEYSDANINPWGVKGELRDDIVPDDDNGYYTIPVVKDMTYDHVALKALGAQGGVAGSITAPIVKGQVQTHTTTFDLSDGIRSTTWKVNGVGENLLQDKSSLKVVALLLNTNTGEIINAAQCDIDSSAGATR